jgi:hypothetical protein
VKQIGKQSLSRNVKLSVFNILNIFHQCWFLLTNQLKMHIFLAQKAKDRKKIWVKFSSQFHTHLVKCAVALAPHSIQKVKKVMFVYLLELLNRQGHQAFFDLTKDTRIATQVQKKKKQLTWRRNCALRQEHWKVTKEATKGVPQQQCKLYECKFTSCKTAKHY